MDYETLRKGTLVYHGTDNDDFDEEYASLDGPAWVSTSEAVARNFVLNRSGWGGVKRIITYELGEDVSLPVIRSQRAMAQFAEDNGISLNGVEEIRDSLLRSELPGWWIPNNYPDGDDILLKDTSILDHVKTIQAFPLFTSL